MEINYTDVLRSLSTIRDRFGGIHEDSNYGVLVKAESMLRYSKDQFDESTRQGRIERPVRNWGFRIDPDSPLRFKRKTVGGLDLRVDLFSRTYWDSEPAEQPVELNVVIRVWCMSHAIYFRSDWDANRLQDAINPNTGRVILRIHCDLANTGQQGPQYHVQFGGNPHEGEFSWFPEALSVPRLNHMPMDLVLATEMIAATFYKDEYKEIRREPTWKHAVRTSQEHLLLGYFNCAMKAVAAKDSVLEALWNVDWE